jgi:predicted dehydrogenase
VRIRVGLIGCGTVARRMHLPAFKKTPDADVVAFASRSVASAQAAAVEYGAGKVFDDWRELIGAVDAVDICSPNASHVEQAIAAAESGKHVLVEKPMACTVDEADAMLRAARDAGVVLHVAHNMRYVPAVVAARDEIARGAIGELVGARAAFGHSGPHHWAPEASWFHDPALSGGGPLIDLGIHAVDFVRFVTQTDVREVAAMLYGDGPVEDAAHVLMRFTSGATGSLHASWAVRPAPDFGLTLFGTQGTLHVDARTPLHVRTKAGDKRAVELPEVTSSPCEDFVRTINGETGAPAATGQDGRAALAVVCAAYEAARAGRTVRVA